MSEADYAGLIAAAHHQLPTPVILIWDDLNARISAVMGRFVSSHQDWLTEGRLPAHASAQTGLTLEPRPPWLDR